MAEHQVNIDLDKKCIHCGEPGPVMVGTDEPGLCLKCIGDSMEGEEFMSIGWPTIQKIGENVSALLREHDVELNEAWFEAGDEPLDISCKVRLETSDGGIKIQTGISFTTKKVKDSSVAYFNENQGKLFKED